MSSLGHLAVWSSARFDAIDLAVIFIGVVFIAWMICDDQL